MLCQSMQQAAVLPQIFGKSPRPPARAAKEKAKSTQKPGAATPLGKIAVGFRRRLACAARGYRPSGIVQAREAGLALAFVFFYNNF